MEYSLGRKTIMVLILVLVAATFFAKRSDAACGMNKEELYACKPAAVSNPALPSQACCSALATADIACFCTYRNSLALRLFAVDFDVALLLPKKCGLPPPPPNC